MEEEIENVVARHRQERDPKENADTSPPDDERIDVPCIWAAELYLPSHFERLIEGVRALGWSAPDHTTGMDTLESWIRKISTAPAVLKHSSYLQAITRPNDKQVLGRGRHAQLPDGVDYARGSIHCARGTILAIVMQFVLKDELAGLLESELRRDRQSFGEPHGRSWSLKGPLNQKVDSCLQGRRRLREIGESWFREHLPGFFAGSGGSLAFPTAEFIIFRNAAPFEQLPDSPTMNYMRVLGMDRNFNAYASQGFQGVKVGVNEPGRESALTLTLAAKEAALFEDESDSDWKSWGGRGREGYTNRLGHYGDTLNAWALSTLQSVLEVRLTEIRNTVAAIDLSDISGASKRLHALQSNLLRLSGDIVSAVPVLELTAQDSPLFHAEVDECLPLNKHHPDHPHLFEGIRQSLVERCAELRRSERDMRATIMAQGSLVATAAQDRATSNIVRLTFVLVGLTVILVVFAVALFVAN